MYDIVPLDRVPDLCRDPDKLVVVEASPEFGGINLLFQTLDDQAFLARWREWISRYMCTNELFMLRELVRELETAGHQVLFTPSTEPILNSFAHWDVPLEVDGFTCPGDGDLYPFQTFTLNRALERASAPEPENRLFFAGWCAGAGKSLFACAGAQELFNRDQIDLVLCFTLMSMKHNFAHAAKASFEKTTQLKTVVPEGAKGQRRRAYAAGAEVFVLNYEKAWADHDELKALTEGKRVLWVLDECQKVVTSETAASRKTKTRKHLDNLVRGSHATVWPMSASVVGANPLRYRDVFNLAGTDRGNPLGTAQDFEGHYSVEIKKFFPSRWADPVTYYTWSLARLHEVRHRVSDRTQSARKTDPGVREFFKGNKLEPVPIQMAPEVRKLYDAVIGEAMAFKQLSPDESLMGHYLLLRYVCNTPLALGVTTSEAGRAIADKYPKLITNAHNAKLEFFLDQVETIADAGEKVIAFTHWTNLGLHLLAPEVKKRGIKHVLHWGVGQTPAEKQEAQRRFKEDDEITLFLSSDAGAAGLSLPEAKYNISYECPYAYDLLMQRSERNNRADSEFDTTTYVYITENTVEERIWEINEDRRKLAAATLGTTETLNYGGRLDRSEEANAAYLIFGK